MAQEEFAEATLLLVESPSIESERYRTLAKRAGFKIMTAHSGPMTRAVSQRARPDLVLLSPEMGPPGPSELARHIKEDPKTRDIPVMILVESDVPDVDLSMVYPTEACASASASDEDLIQTMRALRSPRRRERVEEEPSSPLEGDLADDTLPGVLEFLFMTGKTGRVIVLRGSKSAGLLYVDGGNVVHAEFERRRGVAAFSEMCFLKRGRFKFEPHFRPARRTMNDNGMTILLDAARVHDELTRTQTELSPSAV